MRAFSLALASTVAFSAPAEAGSDTTPATVTAPEAVPAKPAKQPRKLRAKAKPEAKPVAPEAPAPVEPAPVAAEPAVRPLPIARTCATIARQATNFGNLTDRDLAYISYYAKLAKATSDGIVTVRAIADHFAATGARPGPGFPSAKPHDAGVIVRLTKAGLIEQADGDGTAFRFTERATSHKAYAQA